MSTKPTVERIIRANPVPDEERVFDDPAESSALFDSFTRRRDEMSDTRELPRGGTPHPPAPWYRRRLVVAAAAALAAVAVILPAALFGGAGDDPGGAATVPEATTTAGSTTTDVTTTTVGQTTIVGGETQLQEERQAALDEILVNDRIVRNVAFVNGDAGSSPDGLPVVLYWYEGAGSGLGLLRCLDPRCVDFDPVDIPYDEWPPLGLLAFLPDGAPIFEGEIEPPGEWGEDNPLVSGIATLFVCSDPSCAALEPTPLETDDDLDLVLGGLNAVIGDDGLPVLYAQSGAPPATPRIIQIRCLDRACGDREVETIVEGVYIGGLASDVGGRLIIGAGDGQMVVCQDPLCETGASLVASDTLAGTIPGAGPSTGYVVDSGSSMVRICSRFDLWCDEDVFVDLGMELWSGPVSLARTADGNLVMLFATPLNDDPEQDGYSIPGDLWLGTCIDGACSSVVTEHVATLLTEEDFAAGRWVDDGGFSLWASVSGSPMVAYSTYDGLHLIRCPDRECLPPE